MIQGVDRRTKSEKLAVCFPHPAVTYSGYSSICNYGEKEEYMKSISVKSTIRVITLCGILAALSVIGKLLNIGIGNYLRISLENTPVIAAGLICGPLFGALTGVVADIVGCILHGYAISPIITVGMAAMGALPGIVALVFKSRKRNFIFYLLTAIVTYAVASCVIKSIGLAVYFGYDIRFLLLRIPFEMIKAIIDTLIIYILSKPWQKIGQRFVR